MATVWSKLEERAAPYPRHARFVCVLCVAWPDGKDAVFRGEAPGHLVWPQRGRFGFGFDPMFVPFGHHETFGEMHPDRKHEISHRAQAFAALKQALLDGRQRSK